MYEQILTSARLSENERKVYTLLLSTGEQTAAQISQKTGIKRGNTYYVIDGLVDKELVEEVKKGKKTFFRNTHPQKLEAYIEQQLRELEEARKTVSAALPALTSNYNLTYEKPGVYFFEGKEGLKKVFQDIYAPDKDEVIGCVELEKLDEVFPDVLEGELVPKRVRGKLKSIALIIDSAQARALVQKDKAHNRESILVDGKRYPMPAEIDVYKDRVALLSFAKGKFVGVVIENEDIARTMRSIMLLARDASRDSLKTSQQARSGKRSVGAAGGERPAPLSSERST